MQTNWLTETLVECLTYWPNINMTIHQAFLPTHFAYVHVKNNLPNCSKSNKELSIYPGETFQTLVVSTGQRNGIVPAQVRSHMNRGKLLSSQYVQQTTKMCTTLKYTVFSQQNVSLELYADGPCSTFGNTLILQLNINQKCPTWI